MVGPGSREEFPNFLTRSSTISANYFSLATSPRKRKKKKQPTSDKTELSRFEVKIKPWSSRVTFFRRATSLFKLSTIFHWSLGSIVVTLFRCAAFRELVRRSKRSAQNFGTKPAEYLFEITLPLEGGQRLALLVSPGLHARWHRILIKLHTLRYYVAALCIACDKVQRRGDWHGFASVPPLSSVGNCRFYAASPSPPPPSPFPLEAASLRKAKLSFT